MRLLVSGGYTLTEGARWVDGRLVYVDILSGRLFEVVDDEPRLLAQLDVPLGAVAPVAAQPGWWIAAAGTGIALLGPSGTLDWLARLEDDTPQPRRMNDGVCDPAGRFWAGSMAYDNTPGAGSLYRVDTDGAVTRVLDGMTVVNGPAFSADGRTMYVADSDAGRIDRCELDAAGDVVRRDGFAQLDGPAPDGMTVDRDGRLWSALWDGAAVHVYAPDGALERELTVPARNPTSVCLAGGKVYVTTAGGDRDTEGAVLVDDVDVDAPDAVAWAG